MFGRGRALEVILANVAKPTLNEDLTSFLSGACSCQVKEQNPGFDLLLSVNWDGELHGEGGLLPRRPNQLVKAIEPRERFRSHRVTNASAGKVLI